MCFLKINAMVTSSCKDRLTIVRSSLGNHWDVTSLILKVTHTIRQISEKYTKSRKNIIRLKQKSEHKVISFLIFSVATGPQHCCNPVATMCQSCSGFVTTLQRSSNGPVASMQQSYKLKNKFLLGCLFERIYFYFMYFLEI